MSRSTTPNKPRSDRALKFKSPNFLSPARAAAPTTSEGDIVLQLSGFQWGKSDRDSISTLEDIPGTKPLPDTMNHEPEAALSVEHARPRSDSTGSKISSQGGLLVSPPSSPVVKPTRTAEVDADAPIETSSITSSESSDSSRRSSLHDLSLVTGTTSLPPSVIGVPKTHSRLPSASSLSTSAPVLLEPMLPDSEHEPSEPISTILADQTESLGPPLISFTPANPPMFPESLVSNSEHNASELGLSAPVGGMESRSRFPSFSFTPSRASSPPPVPITSTKPVTARSSTEPIAPSLKPTVSTSSISLTPQSTLSPSRDASETLDPRSPLTNPSRIIFNNPFAPHVPNEGQSNTDAHKEGGLGLGGVISGVPDSEANQLGDSLEGRLGLIGEPEKQPDLTIISDVAKGHDGGPSLEASGSTAHRVIAFDSWTASQPVLPIPAPEQSDKGLEYRPGSRDSSQSPDKSANDSGKQSDWSIDVVPVTPRNESDQTEDISPAAPPTVDATIVDIVALPDADSNPTPLREPLPPFSNPSNSERSSSNGRHESKPSTSSSSGLASEDVSQSVGDSSADATGELDLSQRVAYPIAAVGLGEVYRAGTVRRDLPSRIRRAKEPGSGADVVSRSKHPNVLDLIEFTTFRGQVSVVLSWVREGAWPCVNISAGLAHLHEADYGPGVHLVVSKSRVAKCTDIGDLVTKTYTLEFTGTTSSVLWAAGMLTIAMLIIAIYAFMWGLL